MRENLSLLSYRGLVFMLAAVTLFVVVYSCKKNTNKDRNRDMIDNLRRRSVAVYLGAELSSSEDISKIIRAAADEVEHLRAENSVMFWLIIVMNAVVAGLLALAYKIS